MNFATCPKCKATIPVIPRHRVVCLQCGTDYGYPVDQAKVAKVIDHVVKTGAEFCPRCGYPIEPANDPARLCTACGWFGDSCEALPKPPPCDEFNPTLCGSPSPRTCIVTSAAGNCCWSTSITTAL